MPQAAILTKNTSLDPRLIPCFHPHFTATPFTGVDDATDLSLKVSFNTEKTPSPAKAGLKGSRVRDQNPEALDQNGR